MFVRLDILTISELMDPSTDSLIFSDNNPDGICFMNSVNGLSCFFLEPLVLYRITALFAHTCTVCVFVLSLLLLLCLAPLISHYDR